MKANFKTRILGTCTVFLIVFGTLILKEYMANHLYYYDMIKNTSNIYIMLTTLICAAIPLTYILYWKNASIKGLARTTWIGLMLYGILYASIRENILGTGAVMRAINSFIIFGLSVFIIVALTSIGTRVYKRLYANSEWNWKSLIMSFGIGFGIFMVFNYFLILIHVYFPIINRLQLIALGYIIRKSKSNLEEVSKFLNMNLKSLFVSKEFTKINWIVIALILISFAYYMIGFKLSYIPYPTARDANHAYMLIPNAISGSFGWNWNTNQATVYMPVYLSFVSFFFSIIKGLGSKFWISPDTFGVQMNYLSAIFTFITTLGIITKVLDLVTSKNEEQRSIVMSLGWFTKILWLTSGMGAFLVFVDNKSDFGIMYLSCLGLFAGLGYINYVIKKYNQNQEDDISKREGLMDLYLSGIFFALAVASKVTALFDAMNFILLIVGFLLGGVVLIGVSLIIMAALTYLGLNGIGNFIAKPFANIIGLGGGALVTILGLGKGQYKNSYSYWPKLVAISKQVGMRGLLFVLTLAILKLPIAVFRLVNDQTQIHNIPKEMVFGKAETQQRKWVLLASTNVSQLGLSGTEAKPEEDKPQAPQAPSDGQLSFEQCNLGAVGISNTEDLYKTLLTPPGDGYSEDVGRYVGFGQKDFANPWWGFLVPSNSCISINKSAKILCKNQDLIATINETNIKTLQGKLKKDSDAYQLVTSILTGLTASDKLSTFESDSQKKLNDFRKDKVISKAGSTVGIPYKILVPLNVTFNWSLQNLSSYYTDIGIIRLFIQFFIIVGFIYGLCTRNRIVRTINLVALIGRLLRIAIGGGIVWYGIGLITRSIMGFIVFVHDLYLPSEDGDEHKTNHTLFTVFIGLFLIFGVIQLFLNFVRISSQGGSGPFLQYRYSNGQVLEIDDNLQQKVSVKFPFRWTDILSLQFPHYTKVIQEINKQTGKEVNLVAGTYSQYWINDQKRVYGDGLLVDLWKQFSDGNLCKSYLRLKDKNFKYMIIDPNIASIVMGGGNSSLMERFFAKIDPASGKIVTDGALSTLGKLINNGYLRLYSSNNLGAKYGFGLDSTYLKSKFGITSDDDLAIFRARMATLRYRGNQEQMIQGLSAIFTERIVNGEGIADIADVFGKVIDETKLKNLVDQATQKGFPSIATQLKDLTQDEKYVLLNYLNILTTYNKQPAQFGSVASNIVNQSLGGGSQLIVFEVR